MTKKLPHLTVAIDGPAGSGKSTIAAALARRLGIDCINTGYMYRAAALLARRANASTAEQIAEFAQQTALDFEGTDTGRTVLNGIDLTSQLGSPAILPLTSLVAQDRTIRERLTSQQRQLAFQRSIVMEGRDIGTDVLPNATWKFFLDADEDVRLSRLHRILTEGERKQYPTPDSYRDALRGIDLRDRTRPFGALRRAADAILHVTHGRSPEEEAVVLEYYIKCHREISRNVALLPANDN